MRHLEEVLDDLFRHLLDVFLVSLEQFEEEADYLCLDLYHVVVERCLQLALVKINLDIHLDLFRREILWLILEELILSLIEHL